MPEQPVAVPLDSINTKVRLIADLDDLQREQLYALMSGHFANVDRAQFFRDLDEKQHIVLVSDGPEQRLCGFSTLMLYHAELRGSPVAAVFAGDTVMEPAYWGYHGWAREWGHQAYLLARANQVQPVYFVLLTATHRSYRFLPAVFREYYPRPDKPTPPEIQDILDALVHKKFPAEYDAGRGVVSLNQQTPVRPERLDPSTERLNEHVAYFIERNPGYQNGDFLACITELSRPNLTSLGLRFAGPD